MIRQVLSGRFLGCAAMVCLLAADGGLARAGTGRLAKFEPARGCYIGAFIERDFTVQGDINVFEELTKKKHASYFTYVGYGQPFPAAWVAKVKERGAAPHIAFEPNHGLEEVADSQYLRSWARDANRAQCPIFLRWASEMNGPWTAYSKDPELYREKFRLVSTIMKQEAPDVAMVWTPFAEPQSRIPLYYPGDDYVDWVGVNIYSVYVHNGDPLRPAFQEDPIQFLRYIYDNYAERKPIHISEFAATIYCKGSAAETVSFAIEKMTRFYTALREQFPRVKAVNWFCLDTIRSGLANNNYSLLDDGRVLKTYRDLVQDDYFLSQVAYSPADLAGATPQGSGTTLGPDGVTIRTAQPGDEEPIINIGAIAATLDKPMLRGLKEGDVIHGDLELRVQLPLALKPRYLLWQIDGRTMALSNTAPYRRSIDHDRIGPGRHTVRVLVVDRDADGNEVEHPTQEIPFELAP